MVTIVEVKIRYNPLARENMKEQRIVDFIKSKCKDEGIEPGFCFEEMQFLSKKT